MEGKEERCLGWSWGQRLWEMVALVCLTNERQPPGRIQGDSVTGGGKSEGKSLELGIRLTYFRNWKKLVFRGRGQMSGGWQPGSGIRILS